MNPKFIVINVTSWVGISIGAEHYYASYCPYLDTEGWDIQLSEVDEWSASTWEVHCKLERPLTESDAKSLNKKENWRGMFRYKVGDMSDRFDTIKQIVQAATKKREELGQKCPMVFLSEGSHFRPQMIIE